MISKQANVASDLQVLIIAIATDYAWAMTNTFTQMKFPESAAWARSMEGRGKGLRLLHYFYGHALAKTDWCKKWLEIVSKSVDSMSWIGKVMCLLERKR